MNLKTNAEKFLLFLISFGFLQIFRTEFFSNAPKKELKSNRIRTKIVIDWVGNK